MAGKHKIDVTRTELLVGDDIRDVHKKINEWLEAHMFDGYDIKSINIIPLPNGGTLMHGLIVYSELTWVEY